jgi:predicted nucleic acid-binding protein
VTDVSAPAFVDTDVIIRLLVGDDLVKQAAAAELFRRVAVGELTVAAPVTVIADAVHVLKSPALYHLPRPRVRDLLAPLVGLPHFRVRDKAVELDASTNLEFGDAMIVASMESRGASAVYSYDRDFDRVPRVERREPPGPNGVS